MCDWFPRKFDVQTSYKPSNYVLGLIFVVNIKFPQATYHTIVPSTEELYCLNSVSAYTPKHVYPWLTFNPELGQGQPASTVELVVRDGTAQPFSSAKVV